MNIYFDFLQQPHAGMFAMDVAARGLDFPNFDWVAQVGALEDKEMYIHRVGQTVRYTSGGKSLLMVTHGEEMGMTKTLQDAKVPIEKLSINPTKLKGSEILLRVPMMNTCAR
jgi:ATP-dependent RNA helicase DDX10/DBP4